MLEDEGKRRKVRELLAFADLGVTDLRVTTAEVPDEVRNRLTKVVFAVLGSEEFNSETMDRIMQEANRGIELIHQVGDSDETVSLDFAQESLGTQNWLALIGPMLEALEHGSVLLVDEIDASLHPRLSNELIRVFHDCELNQNGAQLIFNTHDPSLIGTLLGDSPLRRDEVRLTEKDKCGVTHLYPLTEFRPRKAENLERGYLQGRYGGVPFVDHEHLADAITGSARR
jgi:AAA15 family ATPase/GTPase